MTSKRANSKEIKILISPAKYRSLLFTQLFHDEKIPIFNYSANIVYCLIDQNGNRNVSQSCTLAFRLEIPRKSA